MGARRGVVSVVRRSVSVLLALGVVLVTLSFGHGSTGTPAAPLAAALGQRPNIVLVTADDARTDDLRWMPLTRRALAAGGRSFPNAVASHPLCCPARAELLSGQYGQNNRVQHNEVPYGGWERFDGTNTLATWLADAGYNTAFHGKYIHGFPQTAPPEPGWTRFDALLRNIYHYGDFTLANNGSPQRFEGAYLTDVLARRTNATIRSFSRTEEPFFVWASHVAPHGSFRNGEWNPPPAARRHRELFQDAVLPTRRLPSFNEPKIADQPSEIGRRAPMSVQEVTRTYRARLRALQALDEAVASIVTTLRETGELDNTWIVFTSDNGYALGEHRYVGKNYLNSEILDVPLVVRGPGVEPGSSSSRRVALVDLPVTFAAMAGATPARVVDGRSFLRDLRGLRMSWRDTHLIQTGDEQAPGWAFRGVLTQRYSYARDMRNGQRFLYDHRLDRYEVTNRVGWAAYADVVAELERRARILRRCSGADCAQRFGPVPAPSR